MLTKAPPRRNWAVARFWTTSAGHPRFISPALDAGMPRSLEESLRSPLSHRLWRFMFEHDRIGCQALLNLGREKLGARHGGVVNEDPPIGKSRNRDRDESGRGPEADTDVQLRGLSVQAGSRVPG